jgi:hypothetical protein
LVCVIGVGASVVQSHNSQELLYVHHHHTVPLDFKAKIFHRPASTLVIQVKEVISLENRHQASTLHHLIITVDRCQATFSTQVIQGDWVGVWLFPVHLTAQ